MAITFNLAGKILNTHCTQRISKQITISTVGSIKVSLFHEIEKWAHGFNRREEMVFRQATGPLVISHLLQPRSWHPFVLKMIYSFMVEW
jgi:hypothetical protein